MKALSFIGSNHARESRRIALGVGSAWTQFATSIVFSFLRYRMLFTFIPPGELGLGVLMMTGVTFLAIFDSTLAPGITTEVGKSWSGSLPGEVLSSCRYVYGKALPVFVAASVVMLPVMIFFARGFGSYSLIVALWLMFAVRAGLGIFANGKFHILTGTGWYYAGKTSQMISEFTGLTVLYLGLKGGMGVIAIGLTGIAEGMVLWLSANWFLRKRFPSDAGVPPSPDIVQRLKSNAFSILGNSLGVFFIYNTDSFFLAKFVGSATIADYSLAYKLAFMIPTLCYPVFNNIYPRFVNALKDSRHSELHEFFRLVRLNHALATAVGLAVIVFGKTVIDLWVGPGHFIGQGVIAIMVTTFMLENIHFPHGYTFLSKGRPRILMYSAIAAGLLNLAFTGYLAPRYGAPGVAAGTFAAQLICANVVVPIASLRALKYGMLEYGYRVLLPIVLMWLIPAAAYWVFGAAR